MYLNGEQFGLLAKHVRLALTQFPEPRFVEGDVPNHTNSGPQQWETELRRLINSDRGLPHFDDPLVQDAVDRLVSVEYEVVFALRIVPQRAGEDRSHFLRRASVAAIRLRAIANDKDPKPDGCNFDLLTPPARKWVDQARVKEPYEEFPDRRQNSPPSEVRCAEGDAPLDKAPAGTKGICGTCGAQKDLSGHLLPILGFRCDCGLFTNNDGSSVISDT